MKSRDLGESRDVFQARANGRQEKVLMEAVVMSATSMRRQVPWRALLSTKQRAKASVCATKGTIFRGTIWWRGRQMVEKVMDLYGLFVRIRLQRGQCSAESGELGDEEARRGRQCFCQAAPQPSRHRNLFIIRK